MHFGAERRVVSSQPIKRWPIEKPLPLLDTEAGKEAGQRINQAVGYRLPPLLSMTARNQAADSFGMRAMV